MNQTLTQLTEKAAGQTNSSYVVLFAIVIITLIVLMVVLLVLQRNKINELQRPKYGFLGKPLMAMALVAVSIGGIGFTFYSANNSTAVEQTSADKKIDLKIKTTYSGNGYDYYLNLIPTFNQQEWGGNHKYKFDVYWTIKNNYVVTEAEVGLNLDNKGGILKSLERGKNKIKVTVFFEGKSYTTETTLDV
jgi:hypothetical protein